MTENSLLEKNLKAMEDKLPGFVMVLKEKIQELREEEIKEEEFLSEEEKDSKEKEEEEINNIEAEYAQDENIIFRVEKNGRKMYLNGRYAPGKEVEEWYQGLKKINYRSVFIMYGIGSGLYLKKVIEETENTVQILLYEPSIKIFLATLECVDLQEVLKSRVIGFVVKGVNEDEFEGILGKVLYYENLTLYHNFIHPNYIEIFAHSILEMEKKVKKYLDYMFVNWNTAVRYTGVVAKNAIKNCRYIPYHYKAYQLMNSLPVDIPAIVVSAGPSLNKNIKELKKAKGKAFIIAVDTAVKPLLKAGIKPDVFVIVDGLKPLHLFEIEGISEIPIVTPSSASSEVLEYHKGKKFFFGDGYPATHLLYSHVGKELEGLKSGGSVANNAFSLAQNIGYKTIILVGQDLAMTNGRSHADGTFQEKMEELILVGSQYKEVDGIDGGKVITRNDFNLYLKWFETQIKENPQLKVIDATEGGAMIHGCEIMTLKKAIAENCKRKVDIQDLIEKIPPVFTKKEQKVLEKYFKTFPKAVKNVQKVTRKGISLYNQLEKVCKKKNFDKEKYLEIIKKIRGITFFMEADIFAYLVIESLRGVDYVLSEGIYEVEEDTQKEGLAIARQGKYMLQCMLSAAIEIEDLLKDTISDITNSKEKFIVKK